MKINLQNIQKIQKWKSIKPLVASLLLAGAMPSAWAEEVSIKILGTSDVHGRVVAWNYGADTEDRSGSYAQLKTYVDNVRQQHKNVILVDIGDAIQDNQIDVFAKTPSYYRNHPIPKVLNAMKYDAFVLGNHEFNFGMTALDEILKDIKAHKITANFYHQNGKRYLKPYTIIQKQGVKIGLIGITTPMSAEFEKDTGYLDKMKFTSPIAETKKQIADLKKQGVDAIVVLAHMGIANENKIPETGVADLVAGVDGIDVIIAGHEHKNVPSETINQTLITEPHRYGTVISEVDLVFNVDKTNKAKNKANKTKRPTLLSKTAKTVPVHELASDKTIERIYQPYHDELRRLNNVVIGQTERDLVPQGQNHGVSIAFSQDTGLSTLIHTVQQYYSQADVVSFAFDYETVRLDKGDIKKKDIIYNYRYAGGDVSVYQLTGKQLKQYMNWSADYFDTIQAGDTQYRYNAERKKSKYVTFDLFGGVKYEIDLRKEKGDKIQNLTLADGRAIDDNMVLKVGMNSYRFAQLNGKGGIWEGEKIPVVWESKVAMGSEKGRIQSMLLDYIENVKQGKIEGVSNHYWKMVGL